MSVTSVNLRPLKAGEILDRAFHLYRANFWLFVGVSSVLLVPLLVLKILSTLYLGNDGLVSLVQSFLTLYLLNGAMLWMASCAYLGMPTSMNASYREARRCFRSFFGANFSQGIAYIPAGILAVVVVSIFNIGTPYGSSFGGIVAFIIAAPYILFLSTRWWLATPVIMFEKKDGANGLSRSWSLTSKNFWHVAIVSVASTLLSYLVVSLPEIIIGYAMVRFEVILTVGPMLSSVITQLGSIVCIPLSISILVITYYDLRVRREGYDIEFALQTTASELLETSSEEVPEKTVP